MRVLLGAYAAGLLLVAAVLAPLPLLFIPLALLAWCSYLWWRPVHAVADLLTAYFIFFAAVIILAPHAGPIFSLLVSLPLLWLVFKSLEKAGRVFPCRQSGYGRRPASLSVALFLIAAFALVAALLLGSLPLLLASAAVAASLAALAGMVLRRFPLKPVEEEQVKWRMVAGTADSISVRLTPGTRWGGLLFLESPYRWLKVSPGVLSLNSSSPLEMKIYLRPELSGPSVIKLKAYALDRWGLFQGGFELKPVRLTVVPRAKYAAWLARQYLAASRPGTLPLVSSAGARKPEYGLRRGVEYYGNQLYQPGDSLKNIDWKHSLKYSELVVKEFAEFHGQAAIVLVNLAVGTAEEADRLAYDIITTAISLARENIPAAVAAYDHEAVKVTTPPLQPRQLLIRCLQIAQEMVTFVNPVRYLSPPDIARLRANMGRIRLAQGSASRVLAQLLEMEYRSLGDAARLSPAAKALAAVLGRVDRRSNLVIISQHNHDSDALAFIRYRSSRAGNAVLTVRERHKVDRGRGDGF